jgi:hypothetical protein
VTGTYTITFNADGTTSVMADGGAMTFVATQ